MPLLTEDEARALVVRAFCNCGVPAKDAGAAATGLVMAEMMGISTHGLSRVRVYADRISAGGIDPLAEVAVSAPAPALRLVDGRNGLGPAIAQHALQEGLSVARATGMAGVFCRNANHLGALSPYLFQAVQAGFACLMTTNTAPMIAPAGGRLALVGNNPLGIGLPHPGGPPVFLDMALSVVSRSRVRQAERAGAAIPDSWATDADGKATTDPKAAMRGLMQAIGGGKGANLALCLDMLAAGLSGASMLSDIPNAAHEPEKPQGLGLMILLIDAKSLLPGDQLGQQMTHAAELVANSAPVQTGTPVRLPGARAAEALRRARRDGFDVSAAQMAELRAVAGG
jgi:LDH2 family malate/lactate/ureidoglycolate dehydrogenase